MNPKQKATELIHKFAPYADYQKCDILNEQQTMLKNSKECALIAVNEILNTEIFSITESYWKEVKEEIENI